MQVQSVQELPCPDGKVRRTYIGEADTAFSAPAYVHAYNKKVRGYVSTIDGVFQFNSREFRELWWNDETAFPRVRVHRTMVDMDVSQAPVWCPNAGQYGAEAHPGHLVNARLHEGVVFCRVIGRTHSLAPDRNGRLLVLYWLPSFGTVHTLTLPAEEVTVVTRMPTNLLRWFAQPGELFPAPDVVDHLAHYGTLSEEYIADPEAGPDAVWGVDGRFKLFGFKLHACENPDPVTCGNCGRTWCDRCDPTAVSALCHWCHGRGGSKAQMADPKRT